MRAVRAVWAVFRGFVRKNVDLRCDLPNITFVWVMHAATVT